MPLFQGKNGKIATFLRLAIISCSRPAKKKVQDTRKRTITENPSDRIGELEFGAEKLSGVRGGAGCYFFGSAADYYVAAAFAAFRT